jgi:hypothetical protein
MTTPTDVNAYIYQSAANVAPTGLRVDWTYTGTGTPTYTVTPYLNNVAQTSLIQNTTTKFSVFTNLTENNSYTFTVKIAGGAESVKSAAEIYSNRLIYNGARFDSTNPNNLPVVANIRPYVYQATALNTITSIYISALSGRSTLTDCIMADTITSMQVATFNGSANLKTIKMSSNLSGFPGYWVEGCSSLLELDFSPTKITSYPAYSGNILASLKTIRINSNCVSIANDAFFSIGKVTNSVNSSLDVYFYGSSIPTIGTGNFTGAGAAYPSPLTAYYLPNATNLTNISGLKRSDNITAMFTTLVPWVPPVSNVNAYLYASADNTFPTGIRVTWESPITGNYTVTIYNTSNAQTQEISVTTDTFVVLNSTNASILQDGGTYQITVKGKINTTSSIESTKTSSITYSTSVKYTIYTGTTNVYASGFNAGITAISFSNTINIAGTVYTMTGIGDSVFKNCITATSLTLTSNITSIAASAFEGCLNIINNVDIPSSVSTLGANVFKDCSKIPSISIPSSIITIGASAFKNCSALTSVTSLGTITAINDSTFEGCTNINTAITLPSGVTSIGISAFKDCVNIPSISLPSSVATINSTAFIGCSLLSSITVTAGNTTYSSDNGVLFNVNKTILLYYPGGKTSASYMTPATVTSIGNYAFYTSPNLTSIIITQLVTTVGKYVFNNTNLNLFFYENVPTFDVDSFVVNANIAYKLLTTNNVVKIPTANFSEIKTLAPPTNLQLVPYIATAGGSVSGIYASWTSLIGSASQYVVSLYDSNNTLIEQNDIINSGSLSSFLFSTGLLENISYKIRIVITLQNGTTLTSDYSSLLLYTTKLTFGIISSLLYVTGFTSAPTTITIPQIVRVIQTTYNVVGIGAQAFKNCISLTSITLPSSLTFINDYAFEFCNVLASITLPPSVTTIGKGAFKDCSVLTAFTIPSLVTSISDETFKNCSGILNTITISNAVTSIGLNAFNGCKKITNITLPINVSSIGAGAFLNCDLFTSYNVDVSHPTYTSVSGVLFDKNSTTLINYPMGKTGTSYTVPTTVLNIGESAFEQNLNLTTITLSNVTQIGVNGFKNSNFTTFTIPNSVTTIKKGAFSYCSKLTQFIVDVTHPLFSVDNGVLYNKNKDKIILYPVGKTISSYQILSSVLVIDKSTFHGAINLTSVVIPNTLTTIGEDAFRGCINIPILNIPSTVSSIGLNAFADCLGLRINFLSNTSLVFNILTLNISIDSYLVKLMDGGIVDLTGDVIVNVEIPANVINSTFLFKTTTPNAFDVSQATFKVYTASGDYSNILPKISTSSVIYDEGITSGYISSTQTPNSLPYEYLSYISHIKKGTANGIRGILQVDSYATSMATKIDNAFTAVLQNLHNIEQPYNNNIYIISQSILNEIVNGDPSRLLEMQGTSLGDNWYPNLVQPGDYFYYTCTINPHMNQTGVTDPRTYLIKAKVI